MGVWQVWAPPREDSCRLEPIRGTTSCGLPARHWPCRHFPGLAPEHGRLRVQQRRGGCRQKAEGRPEERDPHKSPLHTRRSGARSPEMAGGTGAGAGGAQRPDSPVWARAPDQRACAHFYLQNVLARFGGCGQIPPVRLPGARRKIDAVELHSRIVAHVVALQEQPLAGGFRGEREFLGVGDRAHARSAPPNRRPVPPQRRRRPESARAWIPRAVVVQSR